MRVLFYKWVCHTHTCVSTVRTLPLNITIAIVVRVIDYPKTVGRHGSAVVCTTRLLRIVTRDLYVLPKVNHKS